MAEVWQRAAPRQARVECRGEAAGLSAAVVGRADAARRGGALGCGPTTIMAIRKVARKGGRWCRWRSRGRGAGRISRRPSWRRTGGDRPVEDAVKAEANRQIELVCGETALGLVGPIPARVEAGVKRAVLELVEHAVVGGWSQRRACRVLGLDERPTPRPSA